ncbi:MAG: phosphoenolpyruvate carboxykinase (GTP) [Spirochaetota bacterium]
MNIDLKILDEENRKKITALNNEKAYRIIEKYINLCKPAKVTVITDSPEDILYVRKLSLKNGEETNLKTEGHTIHFDGYNDQARDKNNTRILINSDMTLNEAQNPMNRDEGLDEVHKIMDGIMKGKEMLVRFFCLGPLNSRFSISALQITDSAYVAHSEDLLYRAGYEQFKNLKGSSGFFYFIHSAGELDERKCSVNIQNRRIYADLLEGGVFTVNNQYAGNSIGLKKLALRLAIYKASKEGWLTEHMFIMGVKPENKNRVTYFTGAFPSACGKTSTAMIPGQLIVGDDIAYIKEGADGKAFAVNIEQGIFGIIEDVNAIDDPLIYKILTTPRELIFSNILINNDKPYWLGMGQELPDEGANFSGDWHKGKKDSKGNEILPAHKNARYTVRLSELENVDPALNDPEGVAVSGFIYGGRDSDTSVPVYQSFDWDHGVFIGATIESETTAATLGQAGVRKASPMANMDFLTIPLGKYLDNHFQFGKKIKNPPLVFATNYFLKEDGNFINDKVDKKVWILWMEGRTHGEYSAIKTPIGYIPEFEDIKKLYKEIFSKDISEDFYNKLFSIRVTKFLEKLDRVETMYKSEKMVPEKMFTILNKIRDDLKTAQTKHGMDIIPPAKFK